MVEHRADGKIKLHQAMSLTGAGAAGGALWGGLIGLLFLAPLFGMAIGAASGAVAGKMSDTGVDDNFMKELGAKMPAGGAALIALGRAGAPAKVIERLKPYGGELIQTSLDDEAEERLRAALGEPVATICPASSTVRRVARRAVAAPVGDPQAAQQPRRQPVLLHEAPRRIHGPGARASPAPGWRRG